MADSARRRGGIPAHIHGPRIVFMLCVLALLLIGFVMVYSAGSISNINNGGDALKSLTDQVVYAVLGAAVGVAIYLFVKPSFWRGRGIWLAWGVAIALILATSLFGVENYGAKRWIRIGGSFTVQGSEFVKIALVIVTVRLFADYRDGAVDFKSFLVGLFLGVIVPLGIMYKTQSDLGTTMICIVALLAVLWYGEVPMRYFLLIVAAVLVFGLIAVFGVGYRADRFAFLDPWNDGQGGYGTGYNIIHSYYAISEGGIFGVGLGNGHEKYQYLFASDSDFVFAVVCEELGMVGAVVVIALFLLLAYTGTLIARSASDDFGTMLAGGLTVALVFQAFLNMGCAIGVFPTTGKPLPFISSGGSSVIASLMMVGLILSVSRDAAAPSVYDRRRADLRVVRTSSGRAGEGSRDGAPSRRDARYPGERPRPARESAGRRSNEPRTSSRSSSRRR